MYNTKQSGGLREIITRATVAKGQKRYRQVNSVVVTTHPVEEVLGYRVTNHTYVACPKTNSVEIKGRYDVHIWYSYDNGTQSAVEKKTVSYTEYLPVVDLEGERLCVDEVVSATIIREPHVLHVHLRRGSVEVEVEMEVYAEIIGETKLWVKVYPAPYADDKKAKDAVDLDDDGEYFDEDDFEDEDDLDLEEEEDLEP